MFKDDVIKFFGNSRKLARVLNMSPSAISQWGKVIPEKNAYKLQYLTKGKLKVDSDLYSKA